MLWWTAVGVGPYGDEVIMECCSRPSHMGPTILEPVLCLFPQFCYACLEIRMLSNWWNFYTGSLACGLGAIMEVRVK